MAKKTIASKGLAFGSLFKVFFLGLLFSVGIVMVVLGGLAFFGNHVIFWNNEALIGWRGLGAGILMAPCFAAIFGFIMTLLVAFGLWLYTRVFALRVTLKSRSSFSD